MTGAYHLGTDGTQDHSQTLRRIEAKVDGVDERLRHMDTRLTALETREEARQEHAAHVNAERRWVIALAVTTGLGVGALIMGILDNMGGKLG